MFLVGQNSCTELWNFIHLFYKIFLQNQQGKKDMIIHIMLTDETSVPIVASKR